ncbi:hypothetical protein BO71DRAFT_425138 [Aspergillus ellipticus CBS 707.79]|uniref:Uncharacterized protein n=1 Tax=Aspergillus ellipticus CBS 707.79 TaxID=1448320 RepID=A0A319DPB9_9EURO|nr:hypothetical protein BO71DRAFT_425138 [Aspergillus ellipticus CBS 707.79]
MPSAPSIGPPSTEQTDCQILTGRKIQDPSAPSAFLGDQPPGNAPPVLPGFGTVPSSWFFCFPSRICRVAVDDRGNAAAQSNRLAHPSSRLSRPPRQSLVPYHTSRISALSAQGSPSCSSLPRGRLIRRGASGGLAGVHGVTIGDPHVTESSSLDASPPVRRAHQARQRNITLTWAGGSMEVATADQPPCFRPGFESTFPSASGLGTQLGRPVSPATPDHSSVTWRHPPPKTTFPPNRENGKPGRNQMVDDGGSPDLYTLVILAILCSSRTWYFTIVFAQRSSATSQWYESWPGLAWPDQLTLEIETNVPTPKTLRIAAVHTAQVSG